MFKKAEQQVRKAIEAVSGTTERQVRRVFEAVSGTGVVGRPGEVWVIESGIPAPPALLQNSEPYDGPIPFDAIRHDQAAHDVYVKLNTPRPEPVTEADWTEADIRVHFGWTEAQMRSARASGFPKPTGNRILFNAEGVPYETTLTWQPQVARGWQENRKSLG